MTITHVVTVKATAAHAWKVIGEDFTDVAKWMEAIPTADTIPGPALPGAPVKGRNSYLREKFAPLYQEETISAYNDAARTISTEVILRNLGRFVPMKGYNATITVKETGPETCSITYTGYAVPKWFGTPMKGALTKSLKPGFLRGLEELAHYIETGEPHPRKVATVKEDAALAAA